MINKLETEVELQSSCTPPYESRIITRSIDILVSGLVVLAIPFWAVYLD